MESILPKREFPYTPVVTCNATFPRTCVRIAIGPRVGDIEDDTHDVRIEGGPFTFQNAQRNNFTKLVGLVGKVLWEAGRM